jgi:hypothetical protein
MSLSPDKRRSCKGIGRGAGPTPDVTAIRISETLLLRGNE